VIYGDRDSSSGPPGRLVAVIRDGLAKAGNRDVTVRVFAGADHALREAGADGPDFVPGYLDAMTARLRGADPTYLAGAAEVH
jgi:hypothetical protein